METRNAAQQDELSGPAPWYENRWAALIEQYQPLIDCVCRRCRLRPEDAADVSQTVWLKLFINLDKIQTWEALPGWIKTTAERSALNTVRQLRKQVLVANDGDEHVKFGLLASFGDDVDVRILREERRSAVREGLASLNDRDSTLLGLICADPPVSYETISAQLGMPVGSIGPTRARCLDKLAATGPVRALNEVAA